jgi:hypothetical protein
MCAVLSSTSPRDFTDPVVFSGAKELELFRLLRQGELSGRIIEILVPNGSPLAFEGDLWDYKEATPYSYDGEQREYELLKLVKHVVSFYNSFGGYIVFGVKDRPRILLGNAGVSFDVDDFKKRLSRYTRSKIDLSYSGFPVDRMKDKTTVGVLLILPRPESELPAIIVKTGTIADKTIFKRDERYLRQGHESRPATNSEDLQFLFSPKRRSALNRNAVTLSPILDNNLPPRDPEFVRFIGRESYLHELWDWLGDPFNSVKLLAGLGGVGKTTIVRRFADQLLFEGAGNFEKIIWLTAKKQYFANTPNSVSGKRSQPHDFDNIHTLLRRLLGELAALEHENENVEEIAPLAEDVIEALRLLPSLVIIDDVDSLPAEDQHELFHQIITIAGNSAKGGRGARFILTARLDLGAGAGRLLRVRGMELAEFIDYVRSTGEAYGLDVKFAANAALVKRFHHVTEGSPIFASSILRLVALGDPLASAIEQWKGAAGEEVRRFAFERELKRLTETQARLLYAVCLLQDTSQAELRAVLALSGARLNDDLAHLREYHLLAVKGDTPVGGARILAPHGVQMLSAVLAERLIDPRRIERECRKIRQQAPEKKGPVAEYIHRVVACWRNEETDDALAIAKLATERSPKEKDLYCLLGRAYLRVQPEQPKNAEIAFRTAYDLDCRRNELFPLWIEARTLLEDWRGVVELSKLWERQKGGSSEILLIRAQAYESWAFAALSSNNPHQAATLFSEGGLDVQTGFDRGFAAGRVFELKEIKRRMLNNYFEIIRSNFYEQEEGLEVWLAAVLAFRNYVRNGGIVRVGLARLDDWFRAKEGKSAFEPKSAEAATIACNEIEEMIEILVTKTEPDTMMVAELVDFRDSFRERLERYKDVE